MARRALVPTAVLTSIALLCGLLAVVVPDAVADPAPRVTEAIVDSPTVHALGPITVDSNGNRWVGETDVPVVDELSVDGTTITQAVDLSTSGAVGGTLTGGITALAAGPDGSVWATSSTDDAVVRIDPTTDPATATFTTTSANPQGIQTIGGGAWWVTQSSPPELDYGSFDAAGPSIDLVATFDLPVGSAPTALALAPNAESVWVALSAAGEIDHIDVTQTSSMSEINHYTTADTPDGVAVDANGIASYVTNNGSNDEVGRIDPSDDSQSTTALDHGGARIVEGPDGNMWFTVPSASQIGMVTPDGVVVSYDLASPSTVTGITVDSPDGFIWAAAAESKVEKLPTDVTLADPVGDPLTVSGTLTEGETLTHSSPALRGTGTITPVAGGQWNRCDALGTPSSCGAIAGATGDSYVLTSDDAGHTISFTLSATNPAGTTSLTSDPSAAVAALPPTTTTTSTTTTEPPSAPPPTDPPVAAAPPTTVPPGPTADQIHQFFLMLFYLAVIRAQQAAKCHTVVSVVHHKRVSRLVCKR